MVASKNETRLTVIEHDLDGNGEPGMREKVTTLWHHHIEYSGVNRRRSIAWDKVFNFALALLQSGLLIYLIKGGKG